MHKRKNGSIIPVTITKSPIVDENGKTVAVSNIVKDITVVKERENALVKAKEISEQSAHLKSLFLANMSHEIRTPLNSILGFTKLLSNNIKDEKHRKFVENIFNSGNQLLFLINDIVDVTRLDAGELPVYNTSINLEDIMRKTWDQFNGYKLNHDNPDIEFRLEIPVDANTILFQTDEHRLQQILHNLLSNAFKYTDEGFVEFGSRLENNSELLFYVRDSGVGIKTEFHEKVFDRFQQIHDDTGKTEKVIKGTGLGLAIAQGLARLLGGRIWLESEYGKGSTFKVIIPFVQGKMTKEQEKVKKSKKLKIPNLAGKKILIAEDDIYSLEMLKYILEETGITMFIAEDGEKALSLFKQETVDMLLLDIRLPKIDGYNLIKQIRETNSTIPVIAQSAFAMPEQIQKSIDLGFNEHLTKPLGQESLFEILEKYLK